MGSRYPSHQLSNGLFVSGRPEQPKEKAPTMSSVSMPYTGGDIKKSGELGKMFDIPMDGAKSRKSGPITGASSRTGSFGGAAPHSGSNPNAAGCAGYNLSGHISAGGPGSGSMKKTNSRPLNKHGETIKKSSGPQSGGATRKNSGSIPPSLPATGLITSGPISSGPLNSSGAPRKVSGSLDSKGSIKIQSSSIAQNQAVTTITQEDDYSFRKNFLKVVLWLVILIFVMGFIAGGFILGAVHNPILLIVVLVLFGVIAAMFIWNTCCGRKAIVDLIARHPDTDLRTAKSGKYLKVTGFDVFQKDNKATLKLAKGTTMLLFSRRVLWWLLILELALKCISVVTCGNVPLESSFRRVPRCVYTSTSLYEYQAWGSKPANPKHRHFTWGLMSRERHVFDFYISDFQSGLRALVKTGNGARVTPFVDDSVIIDIKPENKDMSPEFIRYFELGSAVSVIGIVQRNENVLMIVPPPEPIATGWQWTKCIFPASLEGIILRCEDISNNDVIPV